MDIGSLQIKLGADIAQLRTDLAEANRTVSTAVGGMQKAANAAGAALGAIGLGLSASAMVSFVKRAIDAVDALDEMSQRLGVSASQLSALQLAFRQSGIGSDAMATSMAKLGKAMAEGNDGLKALGINVRGTDGQLRSSTAVLLDVADKFAAMQDGAGETALAMELFGKSGAEMVPLLNMGSEGIREMMTQAERLGLVISDDTAKAAGDFNDTIELLGLGMQGIGTRIAADMLPTLNALTGALLESMTQGNALGNTADVLSSALKGLYSIAVGMVTAFSTLGKTLGAAGAQLVAITRGDFAGAVEIGRQWAADLSSSWEAAAVNISKAWDGQGNAAVAGAAKTMRASNDVLGMYKAQQDVAKAAGETPDFDKVMARIRDRTELTKAEAAAGHSLTEIERMRVEILGQLAAGQIKATEAQRAAIGTALAAALQSESAAKTLKVELEAREKLAQAAQQSAQSVADRVQDLRDEEAAAALAATKNIGLAAALEEVRIARLLEARSAAMLAGNTAQVDSINNEIKAREELARLQDAKNQRASIADQAKEAAKALDSMFSSGASTDFSAGFDKASQSLGVFVQTFVQLIEQQRRYEEERKKAAGTAEQIADWEAKNMRAQMAGYGNIAGAAKGFFKEGSKGYKAMSAAEKTFRALELGMALKNFAVQSGLAEALTATKLSGYADEALGAMQSAGQQILAWMGVGQASATAAVANQGNGDPYTAFPRIAWMAAIMASLGFSTGAFGSNGGGAEMSTNTGTGTVFGDSTAQSESLTKSIELLREVDTMTMRYSAQMLTALRNIESSIGGVVNLVLQTGTLNSGSNYNIAEGVLSKNKGDPILKAIGLGGDTAAMDLPIIGDLIGGLQSLWGKTTQEVTKAGVTISGRLNDVINGQGMRQFAEILTKSSSYFGLVSDTSRDPRTSALDADYARQFGLIFSGFSDALRAAAVPLGANLSTIEQRISQFVVNTGNIDLKGLTGDALQERLLAVFSQQGDLIAKSVLPGYEAFIKVGEGYLQTIVRVASGAEEARQAMKGLGISLVALGQVGNKQASDIGAEIVRQSLLAAESVSQTIQRQVTQTTTRQVTTPWDPAVYGRFAAVLDKFSPQVSTVTETITQLVTELQIIPNGIGEIIQNLEGSAEELVAAYRGLVDARTSLRLLGLNGDAVGYDLLGGTGGLDNLTSALESFQDLVLNDGQKAAIATEKLRLQFAKLGLQLPNTAQGFAALVHGIDTSTAAGRELLGQVLALGDGMGSMIDAVKSAKDAALATTEAFEQRFLTTFERVALQSARLKDQFQAIGVAMPKTNDEFKALILGIDSSSEAGKNLLNQLLPLADDFGSLTDSIKAVGQAITDEITRIRGLISSGASSQNYAALQADFATKTAAARAGDQTALDALPQLSKDLLDMAAKHAGSRADLVRIQAATANSLQQTLDIVNATLATGTSQTQAIVNWMKAYGQYTAATSTGAGTTTSTAIETPTASIPTPVTDPLKAYASGGDHPGGWRIVGEQGPELEATGPARYFNAEQTAAMFSGGGGDLASEVRALRATNEALLKEVSTLRLEQQAQAAAIASATGKTARILERVTPDGDAIANREAEAL